MSATVDECPDEPIRTPNQNDRVSTDLQSQIAAFARQLACMRGKEPFPVRNAVEISSVRTLIE
jgi:hypothetical protein